jgi:hypothetical protein
LTAVLQLVTILTMMSLTKDFRKLWHTLPHAAPVLWGVVLKQVEHKLLLKKKEKLLDVTAWKKLRALDEEISQQMSVFEKIVADFERAELQRAEAPPPPLDDLRHLLETHCPVLYAKILEPTIADLREEHSAALSQGHPIKARWILFRGCGALAAAAVCQLGFSLLGRIAALWQARSSK